MKKLLVLGCILTALSSCCSADVIPKTEQYNGNELSYPYVKLESNAAASKINSSVKNIQSKFKKVLAKDAKRGASGWSFYKVYRDDDQYLTLNIIHGEYFKGAAHPIAYSYGLVFDKQTGKKLPLKYFVNPLTPSTIDYMVKHNTALALNNDMKPIGNKHIGSITRVSDQYLLDIDDNLLLIYQEYELGPYALGCPLIRIDKTYVDRNGSVLPKG